MKNKKLRKILTFIFTLTFIASTVMGTLPAFASPSDKTDLVEINHGSVFTSATVINVTENVLTGVRPYYNTYYAPAGTVKTDEYVLNNPGTIANLTDGDFDTEWRTTQGLYGDGTNWFFDGSVYNKFAFDIGKTDNITDIVVAHSTTNTLATGKYKVYVSTDKDTLFDAANLVADVDNTTTNKIQQTITTKEGKTLSGRYVGFIVTMPCINTTKYGNESIYTRIREIGVYTADTTPLPAARAILYTADDSIDLPAVDSANGESNLTAGRVATFYGNTGGKDVQKLPDTTDATTLEKTTAKLKLLTDGATDKEGEANSFVGYEFRFGSTNPNAFYNGRYSAAFVYDLGTSFELTKLALINGAKGTLATSHYMVYASNSIDDLFKDESFVLEVKNTGANMRNLITFNDDVAAQYVGIRIWDPCSDYTASVLADTPTNAYVRMREIAVYGKAIEAGLFTPTADESTTTDTTLGASNLIAGKKVELIKFYGPSIEEQRYDNDGKLTDGIITTDAGEWRNSGSKFADTTNNKVIGSGINIGDYKLDITFGLGSNHKFTGFEVFNATNNSGNTLANYRYQVYISDSQAELFYPENMVVDYTNTTASGRNAFALTEGKEAPQGKYFGLRILDPTCSKAVNIDNIYPRVRELTLYGERVFSAADAIIADNSREFPTAYEGTNIALQSKHEAKFYRGTKSEKVTCGDLEYNLTDGSYETEYRNSSMKFIAKNEDGSWDTSKWVGNGIDEGDIHMDVTVDLNYIANITGLAVFSSPSTGLRNYKYAIYFGNDKKTLYDGEPFYTMVNTDGSIRNAFDISYFNGGAAKSARFVGIRVLDPTNKKPTDVDPDNVYTRLREIAVYGTLTSEGADPEPDYDILNDDVIALPDWGTNIALGQVPSAYVNNQNGYILYSAKNAQYLSDGDVKSQYELQAKMIEINQETGDLLSDHTSFGDGAWYSDIVYDFKSEVTVDGFALIQHSTPSMVTRHFKVYISDKKASLFDSGNMVYEMKDNEFRRNAYNLKGKGKATKGRYVGIRVLAPTEDIAKAPELYGTRKNEENQDETFNHVSTRFFEMAIYGAYTDPDFVYVEPFTPFTNWPEESYFADNLLLGKYFEKISFNGIDYTSGRKIPTRGGVLTDGLITTPSGKDEYDRDIHHWDFNSGSNGAFTYGALDGSQFTDFYWDLKKNYNFTKFAYLGSFSDQPNYYTSWYRVYISDDFDLLYDDESIAFEYNALAEEDPSTICRGQEVNFAKPVCGRYVAIRILNPVYTATEYIRPRITEIGIWGEEAEVDLTPVNLTDKMPVTAYLGDIDNLEQIDDITIKEINNLADGKNNTGATVKSNGKKLHIIYNLCQDAEVYSILINSLKGKTNLKNYKVYASDSQTGVWDKDALVYTHKDSSASGKKEFTIAKTMRYVRIEILDKADTTYIGDIQIIGPKAIQLRNKNLVKNVNDTLYNYYYQDVKSGEIEYYNPKTLETDSTVIHDGLTNIATSISGAVKGKNTMNILIDVGDLRTVNSFRIDFPKRASQFYPTETYVYFGVNADEVQALDAKPSLTFKGLPDKNYLSAEFVPETARYVRICFADAGKNYGLDHLIVALNEITVMGTGIVGMNMESSNVINFEDEKLGIKWGIVRDTTNDIITDIATSEVVVGDATNWQKRSLEKTPYLKVIGGKTYTFKFYDISGKEITDFGGREIEMSFKFRDGMEDGTSMAGYSGNKWYVEVYESNTTKNKGYVTTYSKDPKKLTFSILNMVGSTDEYWSTIGELEDYGDEKPQYAPNTQLDESTSADPIITKDNDFSINPLGALRLPVDAQMLVSYTTYTLTQDVYDAVLPLADPNYIAATYSVRLVQDDLDFLFDGRIKVQLRIPEVLKGYFTGYKLIHMYNDGGADFVDYTREGDYIYFETYSLSKFVLVGEGYSADGSAVLEDTSTDDSYIGDADVDTDTSLDGTSPETGEKAPMFYILVSMLSLAAIVVLNLKKFGNVNN